MASDSDSATTGGLLVVLGAIIALAVVYFLWQGQTHDTIKLEVPGGPSAKIEVPKQ